MWSFKEKKKMNEVSHPIESEMTVDLRDESSRMKAKYNDPSESLNATVSVLKNSPEFIHRQASTISLHHLER